MTSYTWTVEKTRYEVASGRITHLHWKVLASYNNKSISRRGSVYLPNDMTIPFANVTQSILMTWLLERLNVEVITKAIIESELNTHIQVDSYSHETAEAPA